MNILLWEDQRVAELYPITLGRPAYAISCASFRLADWASRLEGDIASAVRPHLNSIQRLDFSQFATRLDSSRDWTLMLNSRAVPSLSNFNRIKTLASRTEAGQPLFIRDSIGAIAAAVLPTAAMASRDFESLSGMTADSLRAEGVSESKDMAVDTLCDLHDIIRFNQQCMTENLQFRIQESAWSQRGDGLFVAADTTICESVVANTKTGPILVDHRATIKPFSYLQGPLYIGPDCTVNEHAAIKDAVCLTRWVKAGGEIEASVLEPYSNKQHHGFLGHSYLGSWINLGAGTCNSDLKNTYGSVNMIRGGQKVATGMQFVGCFMGDYSKSAINTSIFTGKTIGPCSMLYGFVTDDVPGFVNYAKTFGQMTEVSAAIMETTQKRMFERRQVPQRPVDIELLHAMFDLTRSERGQLSARPPRF